MTAPKMETADGEVIHDIKIDYYGQRLATASSDTIVNIISLIPNSTLRPLATLSGHRAPILQVAWAHPMFGSILASCSQDGWVIIWKEVKQNEWAQVRVFHEHESSVNTISCAPHELGLCLACGSSDGTISVLIARSDGGWDTSLIERAHSGGVSSLLWLPAMVPGPMLGSWLLDPVLKLTSGGSDNTIKVWKFFNGRWNSECLPPLKDVGPIPKTSSGPQDDVVPNPQDGLGSTPPKVDFPKSKSTSQPQNETDLGPSLAGPTQDGSESGAFPSNPRLANSTPASPPQDEVGSGESRKPRWSVKEDELLVQAWLEISKGSPEREGDDQNMVSFWKRIAKHYGDKCKKGGGVVRTWSQSKSRWSKIKLGVKKFTECYDQASLELKGENHHDLEIMVRAHRLYCSQNEDKRFVLEHAWALLRNEPKWKAYVSSSSDPPGACMSSSSNPESMMTITTSGGTGAQIGSSVMGPAKKPVKRLRNMTKNVGESEEALAEELAGIKCAVLKKAIAMEELSRAKQLEIDMQIIYKDTSSMSEEQVQFHVQMVQRLKHKYLP